MKLIDAPLIETAIDNAKVYKRGKREEVTVVIPLRAMSEWDNENCPDMPISERIDTDALRQIIGSHFKIQTSKLF